MGAVIYMADDSSMEYLYRFISDEPADRGGDLLDRGVLSVARFAETGTMDWVDLVYGQGI